MTYTAPGTPIERPEPSRYTVRVRVVIETEVLVEDHPGKSAESLRGAVIETLADDIGDLVDESNVEIIDVIEEGW